MTQIDPRETWLNTVAFSHSNSEHTRISYSSDLEKFEDHIGMTAQQIVDNYETLDDKAFKRKYSPNIMSLIGKMQSEGYSPASIQRTINSIKSFFKYNNLPLNFIPTGRQYTVFHNRDITKKEIEAIVKNSQPREKAYYSLMVQSGLRPQTISNLRISDIENLLDETKEPPYLITVRQEATKGKYRPYFSFAGQESINYIREYLKREREQPLKHEDYLFTKDDGKTPTNSDLLSHTFRRTVEKLKKQNILDFDKEKGQRASRNELRLYNLRKYFRNNAKAGESFTRFWMGHDLGLDSHYFSQTNTPKHREEYKEKAMPNLRIETRTPDQNEQTITKLEEENQELKKRLERLEGDEENTVNQMLATMKNIMEALRQENVAVMSRLLGKEENGKIAGNLITIDTIKGVLEKGEN